MVRVVQQLDNSREACRHVRRLIKIQNSLGKRGTTVRVKYERCEIGLYNAAAPAQSDARALPILLFRLLPYTNPLTRVARTRDGRDVTIRVVTIGNEGKTHLKILRKIAAGENSLFSDNHALPLLVEFQFEDIGFCVFPKSGYSRVYAYQFWAKNSVSDFVNMLMQMLEAVAFIHNLKIAHRDAFNDNVLIQWFPESLLTMKLSPSQPRVYLVDFGVAVECPQLDVWQLGTSVSNFKVRCLSLCQPHPSRE